LKVRLKLMLPKKYLILNQKKQAIKLCNVWKEYQPWDRGNKKTWKNDFYNYNKHLKPVFADKLLDTISPFDIEKFIISMKKGKNARGKSYSNASIRHQVILLSRLYSLANKWGLHSGENPCQKVKKPKLNNQITEFLNDDELIRLMEILKNWPDKM